MSEMGYTPRTFSVVFAESNYDESVYARQVATRFGSEHTEIRLTEAAMLGQLPDALAAMDQPTGDGVNTYVVSRAVKEAGVTVALSGLGGDEFFVSIFFCARESSEAPAPSKRLPAAARNAAARVVELAGGRSIRDESRLDDRRRRVAGLNVSRCQTGALHVKTALIVERTMEAV